jgi:hypothetical protein
LSGQLERTTTKQMTKLKIITTNDVRARIMSRRVRHIVCPPRVFCWDLDGKRSCDHGHCAAPIGPSLDVMHRPQPRHHASCEAGMHSRRPVSRGGFAPFLMRPI